MVIVKILSLLIVVKEINNIMPREKMLKDYGVIAMLLIWLAVVSIIPC